MSPTEEPRARAPQDSGPPQPSGGRPVDLPQAPDRGVAQDHTTTPTLKVWSAIASIADR